MAYTLRCLQFGDNDLRVPGYEVDAHPTDNPAQVKKYLAESPEKVWSLVFSYEDGAFFHLDDLVPGQDGKVINAWYSLPGPGPNYLRILPFADGQFLKASNFVHFSETPKTENSICTDEITHPSVTATVLQELPEYARVDMSSRSTSTSIIITTATTHMVFDHFFVIYGDATIQDNTIKVDKGVNCLVLAVYKPQTSKGSTSIGTIQYPRIPWWEWQEIFADMVEGIATKGHTEIYEYMNQRTLADTEVDVLRKAITDIGKRVDQLEDLKAVIAGIAERKRK